MSRTYGGLSEIDRVQRRSEQLVGAGFEIVGTHGVTALGMRAVCREAGLSQKFFYECFDDVDDLLRAVYAAALDRLMTTVIPATQSGDLRGVVDAAAQLAHDDPRVCRVLLVEPVADERLRRHVRETIPAVAQSILGIEGSADDIELRLRFSSLFGSLISLFVEWTEHSLGEDRDQFVNYVVDVIESALSDVSARIAAGD